MSSQRRQPEADRGLFRNTLWRLAQVFGRSGFASIYGLLYTLFVTKADYGLYGLALSFAGVFQMLCMFGMRQSLNRFVATARGAGNEPRAKAVVTEGLRLMMPASGLACALFAGGAVLFGERFIEGPRLLTLAILLGVYIPTKSLQFVLQGVLEGSAAFHPLWVNSTIINVVQLAVVALGVAWGLDIHGLLLIDLSMAALGIALHGYTIRRSLFPGPTPPPDPALRRELVAFGLPLFINGIAGYLYGRVDLVFIQAWLTSEDTADYFLMLRVFDFPLQVVGAFIAVLSQSVAQSFGAGEGARIRRLYWRTHLAGFGVGLGLALLFSGATYLVPWILPDYGPAAYLMRLSAPLLVVKCVSQISSGAFMVSLGRAKTMASFTLAGGLVNLGLNFWLIPRFGVEGAVYSTLIGHTLIGVVAVLFISTVVRRQFPLTDGEAVP